MNQNESSHTKKVTLYGKGIESYSREVEVADLEEFKRQIELQLVQTGKPITAVFKTNDEDGFIDGIADLYRDSQALQMAISIGEEVALTFIPFGQQVDKLTDKVHQSITKNTVKMKKPRYLSKTIWSAILIAIVSILKYLGVDFGASAELISSIYSIIYGLAGAFGLYGLRDAIGQLEKENPAA